MIKKEKILICGILPPPTFGHSMIYKVLMQSDFVEAFDITFLDMHFWSYKRHKKITPGKIVKFIKYYFQFIFVVITKRPKYILYNISFDKMPLLKDFTFCMTGKLLGCRIVLHDMGQYIKELYESNNRFYKWVVQRLARMATASIVLGEHVRDRYQGFMEKDRTIAVPGSVEDSRKLVPFKGEKLENSKNDKISILYFSFLSISKGLFTALRAIPEVIKENKKVTFTFVGAMESKKVKKTMDEFIKKHQMEPYVKYSGYVEDEKKRTMIFRSADIFIFPTHRDVLGLVLLHAMAEELPVVASVEGSIPEIIENGKNGYLFTKENYNDLARNILALASDAQLRKRMGKENRLKYLNTYTPEKYGDRIINAFNKITRL